MYCISTHCALKVLNMKYNSNAFYFAFFALVLFVLEKSYGIISFLLVIAVPTVFVLLRMPSGVILQTNDFLAPVSGTVTEIKDDGDNIEIIIHTVPLYHSQSIAIPFEDMDFINKSMESEKKKIKIQYESSVFLPGYEGFWASTVFGCSTHICCDKRLWSINVAKGQTTVAMETTICKITKGASV